MWSDNETSEDLLGFKVHANLLIDVIKDDTVLPISIGVFGDWGSGKSSILQIIKEKFEQKDEEDEYIEKETLCIYFNGWTFEGYDDAKAALLNAILKELQENKKLSEEIKDTIKEKAKKLWKSIDWMRGAGMALKNVALPAISAYFTSGLSLIPFAYQKISEFNIDSPEKLIEKLKSADGKSIFDSLVKKEQKESNDDKTNAVSEFRNDFAELLDTTNFKRLVVLIDDLDRCSPERIIENLEAVKLFLNVSKTAFVIGADPRIVRHAIENKYDKKGELEEDNSRIIQDYLEKLIQLPYTLPKLSEPEVETYISMLICKTEVDPIIFKNVHGIFQEFRIKDRYSAFGLTNFEQILSTEDFERVKSNVITIPSLVPLITQSLYGNPRQIKRFLNTYTLRQRLANVASLNEFKHDVLAKLMILEYSELKLFKQLFEWQIDQNGQPSQLKEIEEICFDKPFNDVLDEVKQSTYNDWGKSKVIRWLQIEPQLNSTDLRDYFWISRDKIDSSITASSLISPVVKGLFGELQKDLTNTITKDVINRKFSTLSENEKFSFFEVLSISIKKNPETKRLHDIFNLMVEENIEDAAQSYINVLKLISQDDLEPAVGTSLARLKTHSQIGDFLAEYFKSGKSKASRAFNLKTT